jgi:hypothetical protein
MSVLQIQIRNDIPAYTQITELDGTAYTFTFRFNARSDRWYVSISNSSNEILIQGVKIVIEGDLTSRFQNDELPPGMLMALDNSSRGQDPDRFNFGNDVSLFYIDEESLAELGVVT